MSQYTGFIPENTALPGTKTIGIYNDKGIRVGFIPLDSLELPTNDLKQYSFGALSDVHTTYSTSEADLKAALTYLNNTEKVAFTCIAGDLTANGTAEELAKYKAIVDSHSPTIPVYAIAGNHELYSTVSSSYLETYTGRPLYYSFAHGNDLFIMCGCYSAVSDGIFTKEYLQWLYETLEANRNRRCFIFEHVFPVGDSGNACGLYTWDMFTGTKSSVFLSMLKHYKNTILFHGHSHLMFHLQEQDSKANYSNALGYRSVHIPSVTVPRDSVNGSISEVYGGSEGYVVDVYENGVHLRGRDFVSGEFLPIASFWLDTTLETVTAGGFTDSTGTITT